jgi:hypothetical protein
MIIKDNIINEILDNPMGRVQDFRIRAYGEVN